MLHVLPGNVVGHWHRDPGGSLNINYTPEISNYIPRAREILTTSKPESGLKTKVHLLNRAIYKADAFDQMKYFDLNIPEFQSWLADC